MKGGDTLIRDNIKRICKSKGQTITSVEHDAGISRGYIYNMVNPSYATLKRIADAMDVDVCDLIADQEKQE